MKKPTDAEFLNQLYEMISDEWASKLMKTSGDQSMTDHAINSGVFTEFDRDFLNDFNAEFRDPKIALTGSFISALRDDALKFLGPDAGKVSKIPVGFLPTRQVNACTIRTPQNGAVILLDSAVIHSLCILIRCFWSLDTWRTPEPFCRDHSEDEFATSIILLSYYCATGNFYFLKNAPALDCPSLSDYDNRIITIARTTETFILLHEYGHVICGHLKGETTSFSFGSSSTVDRYKVSQVQEFEADQFALKKMLNQSKGIMKPTDWIIGPGLLFCLFGLTEAFIKSKWGIQGYTHPSATDRWKRICDYVNLDSYPDAWANRIDFWFRLLMKRARLA